MSINIENLIIEVTRRCNMECSHCLRGNAQNKDIDIKYVVDIFKQTSNIHMLTFTGGEPSLVPSKIERILELAKQYNVNVGNFYCVTNGKNNSKKFVLAMMEWYMYCSENEVSCVDFSNDKWHSYEQDINVDSLYLNQLKFFGMKNSDTYQVNLLRQGRNKYDSRAEEPDPSEYTVYSYGDGEYTIIGDFYLNVLGELIDGCNFSYEEQSKHVFGNSTMEIQEWAKKEYELVQEKWA